MVSVYVLTIYMFSFLKKYNILVYSGSKLSVTDFKLTPTASSTSTKCSDVSKIYKTHVAIERSERSYKVMIID